MVEEILLVKAPKILIFTREPHIKTDQGCRVVTVAEIAPILLIDKATMDEYMTFSASGQVIRSPYHQQLCSNRQLQKNRRLRTNR